MVNGYPNHVNPAGVVLGFSFEGEGAATTSGQAVAPERDSRPAFQLGGLQPEHPGISVFSAIVQLLVKSSDWQLKTLKKKKYQLAVVRHC